MKKHKKHTDMYRFFSFAVITFLLLATVAQSQVLTGKVVSVADGDTITVLDKNKVQHKIRLYGIDTPEKGQAFGNAAKKFTSNLVASRIVDVSVYDTDRYGRTVGVVMVNGVNVNRSIIEAGYAWQYRKYCKESFCSDWLQLEERARSAKIGLWADKSPVPPWDWRKGTRNSGYSENESSKSSHDTGSYHGNLNSHVFHSSSCRSYNCKNCIKAFKAREEAIAAGYRSCGQCKP